MTDDPLGWLDYVPVAATARPARR